MSPKSFATPRRIIAALALAISATCLTAIPAQAQICLGGVDTNRFERGAELERGKTNPQALHKAGVAALEAGDFAEADANFTALVSKQPRNADANFLAGLAKFGLQDWEGARTYLEVASERDKRRPEPKTRLGLTLIQLGDLNAAIDVYRELEALNERCKGRCKDDEWIKQGIVELGGALSASLSEDAAPE
jgi:tetratricopeptide (TPR) repeat protein